jgi:hypothetical protein
MQPSKQQPAPDSPVGRFQGCMRELVQVPNTEIDRKLAAEQRRKTKEEIA